MSTADQLVASPFPPSDEQDAIQRSRSKTIIVEANAGATKTTTLAFRIRWAIELNVPPEAIQVLTFTEPACEAMRMALNTVGVPPALVRRVKIQTFDAFSATVLRSLEPKAAPVKHTPEDVSPVVVQAMQRLGMSADSGFIERFLNTAGWLKGTLALSEAAWNGEEINEEWAES
ncbi:MAG: UvrD-helicase domain-containing protein, partial [Aquabacterium sp.]|nr:UvrD-helicase domain-containing protein [Aquabacterium sp.]